MYASQPNGIAPPQPRRPGRAVWLALTATALGLVLWFGVGAAGAWLGVGHRHGHGWHHGRGHEERAAFATDWALRAVDASPEQRAQVRAIVTAVMADMRPLADEHRIHHEATLAELSRSTVDRAALERIRDAELTLAAAAGDRLVDGLVRIAEVLTPEQRQELIAAARRFHGHRHGPVSAEEAPQGDVP